MVLEVVHKGVVYDISIVKTDKKPKLVRAKPKVLSRILQVDTKVCPECGALTFNNVCMNRKCIHATGSLLEVSSNINLQPKVSK